MKEQIIKKVLKGFPKDMEEPVTWSLMKGKIQEALQLQEEKYEEMIRNIKADFEKLYRDGIKRKEEKILETIDKFFNSGCGNEFMEFPDNNEAHTIDDGWDVMCGRTMADGHMPLCEDCIDSRDELKRLIKNVERK